MSITRFPACILLHCYFETFSFIIYMLSKLYPITF